MNNVKQIATIAGVVIAFMGTICTVINQGVDACEKIKQLREDNKQ